MYISLGTTSWEVRRPWQIVAGFPQALKINEVFGETVSGRLISVCHAVLATWGRGVLTVLTQVYAHQHASARRIWVHVASGISEADTDLTAFMGMSNLG